MCLKGATLINVPSLPPRPIPSQVGRDDLELATTKAGSSTLIPPKVSTTAPLHSPLVNQYSLTLGQDLGQHDTKSLIKCVETLSFIVRDAAHVTPDNFELCVKAIRVFVEASLNGGEIDQEGVGGCGFDVPSWLWLPDLCVRLGITTMLNNIL